MFEFYGISVAGSNTSLTKTHTHLNSMLTVKQNGQPFFILDNMKCCTTILYEMIVMSKVTSSLSQVTRHDTK